MSVLSLLAGSLIAVTLGGGALAKAVRFSQWQQALKVYRLPRPLELSASVGVPLAEAGVLALLLTGRARAGAALSLALLSAFSLALLAARRSQGDRLPCGCFGRATRHDFRVLIARNAGLACLAGVVLIGGRDRLIPDVAPGSTMLLPVALGVLGVAVALWMGLEVTEAMRKR